MSESQRPRHPLEAPTREEIESEVMTERLRTGRAVRITWAQAKTPWLTWTLLALIVIIFIPGMLAYVSKTTLYDTMVTKGALYWPSVARHNEWWRIISSIFLHADLAHLTMNGLSLYYLGNNLELNAGRRRTLIIFFLSGIAGGLLQLLLGGHQDYGIGASGAIFGMAGAVLLFMWRHRTYFPSTARQAAMQMVALLAFQLMLGFAVGKGIGNWAHLGGLLMGVTCAWLIGPMYVRPNQEPQMGADGIGVYYMVDSQALSGRRWLWVLVLSAVLLLGGLLLKLGA